MNCLLQKHFTSDCDVILLHKMCDVSATTHNKKNIEDIAHFELVNLFVFWFEYNIVIHPLIHH